MKGFEGTRVVVTGGSSGIGLATAGEFVRRGAHVGIVGRNRDKLDAAREQLEKVRSAKDQRVLTASADLSRADEAHAAIDWFIRQGLVPEVLVNSAGVILPGEFETMPQEHLERNMDHGYWSVVWPCRAVAPHMTALGRGHIVNVASVAGFLGIYGYTGYAAAKYAVMGFTEALRFEMKPRGVNVSVCCPPDTDTPALAHEKTLRPPETEAIAGNIKAIPPEHVASAIVRGVERNTYHIIPDATSRFYFRLKGLVPELFFRIVDGDVRKARKSPDDV